MGHFFYYNATAVFMGPEHLLYAILAITVLADISTCPPIIPNEMVPETAQHISCQQSKPEGLHGVFPGKLS